MFDDKALRVSIVHVGNFVCVYFLRLFDVMYYISMYETDIMFIPDNVNGALMIVFSSVCLNYLHVYMK